MTRLESRVPAGEGSPTCEGGPAVLGSRGGSLG